jgi:hypothetical protein
MEGVWGGGGGSARLGSSGPASTGRVTCTPGPYELWAEVDVVALGNNHLLDDNLRVVWCMGDSAGLEVPLRHLL